MKLRNNVFNRLLAIVLLLLILQVGCATTVQKQPLAPTGEATTKSSVEEKITSPVILPVKSGIGLAEITDSNQIPIFKDDYDKTSLLYAIDNSRVYFKKIKSYPDSFKSIGFTPEKQIETLTLFREGYLSSKNPKELSGFIAENFRVFQVIDKKNEGEVQFAGYAFDTLSDEVVTTFKQYLVHYGSTGLPVNPMRSILTMEGALPLGALAFAVIEKGGQTEKTFFVFGHETNRSIKSATKVDVFFGIGEEAVQKAKNFNANGKLYYLLKR